MRAIIRRFVICNSDGRPLPTARFRKHWDAFKAAIRATRRNHNSLYVYDSMARRGAVYAMRIVDGSVDDFFPRRRRRAARRAS